MKPAKLSVGAVNPGASLPSDMFTVVGTMTSLNAYGELYTASDITLATIATFKTLTGMTAGESNAGVTYTDSTITVLQTGLYRIAATFSFEFSAAVTTSHIALFQNTTEITKMEAERYTTTANDKGNMGAGCLIQLTANDVLKLKAESTNNGTLTIHHMNWNIERIR